MQKNKKNCKTIVKITNCRSFYCFTRQHTERITLKNIGAVTKRGILDGAKMLDEASQDAKEISIKRFNDPNSVVNMLPPVVKRNVEALDPRHIACSEKEIRKTLEPTQLDEMLRLSFWDEYTVAVDAGRKMDMSHIYGRICSKEMFYNVVATPLRLAFMLHPPVEYTYKMRDLLELGHIRMREILELPIKNSKGVPDTKLIAEMVKIVALVENRVRGSVVNKLQVEQKNLNINVEAPKNYFEINDDIKKLEREIRQLESVDGRVDESEEYQIKDAQTKEVEAFTGQGGDESTFASHTLGEVLQVAERVPGVEEEG